LISQPQFGNFMGLKESPFLHIGFARGQRVPLLVGSKTVSSSMVLVVQLGIELITKCFIYM
jgi:hypothetical protein